MLHFHNLPIRSPGLLIRQLAPDDAPAVAALLADPAVARRSGLPRAGDGFGDHTLVLAIQRLFEPSVLGLVGLSMLQADSPSARLLFVLSPAAQGRGLMHEALLYFTNLSFLLLPLAHLDAWADPADPRAERCLLRFGFCLVPPLPVRMVLPEEIAGLTHYRYARRPRTWSESE